MIAIQYEMGASFHIAQICGERLEPRKQSGKSNFGYFELLEHRLKVQSEALRSPLATASATQLL